MPQPTNETHPIRVTFQWRKTSFGTSLTIEQFTQLQEAVDGGKRYFIVPSVLTDSGFRWVNLDRVEQIIVD